MTVAVIYVPPGQFDPHAANCMQHCERKGYEIAGVVSGDWAAAIKLICDHVATVIVVATVDHLPADREPRVEIVAEQQRANGRRRTRVIRRDAAT